MDDKHFSWTHPKKLDSSFLTGLKLKNSLTGNKCEFVPISGRTVTWYACGPTVYDASHMGHARTYVSFDIVRRVLADYFGYDVELCMNITDIDDKIIKRSNEQNIPFADFAKLWENNYWTDMAALNVLPPDILTRVSEYMPEVIAFIEKVIQNGYAYESQGSVYFDTQSFVASEVHTYGRMEPTSVSNETRVLEGEGELGETNRVKRNAIDFALWKKAKENEPWWESPWGHGRPGWHIECSAMATCIFGFPLDIHSGGIDLRFPHHDNELAQCEAYFDKVQWVNYFLHSGHLHISGMKMSKSLKNFISIQDSLKRFNPRILRLWILMQRWDAPMEYDTSESCMESAIAADSHFSNFFGLVSAKLRDSALSCNQKLGVEEQKLRDSLSNVTLEVHTALLDNINTPVVLTSLQTLTTAVNSYLHQSEMSIRKTLIKKMAVYIFKILKVFGVTNGSSENLDYIGSNCETGSGNQLLSGVLDTLTSFRKKTRVSCQSMLKDIQLNLQQVCTSNSMDINDRSDIENEGTRVSLWKNVFDGVENLRDDCDKIRDIDLFELGIKLEDTGATTLWKIASKDSIMLERRRNEEKKRQKEAMKQKEAEDLRDKAEKAKVSPNKYYKSFHSNEYSEFDNDGIPTRKVCGAPVSKAQRSKMTKFLEKHREMHIKHSNEEAPTTVPES